MRHILVLNSKGGCGKSTIATSLAAYYAMRDERVTLVDYDRQASSLDWLQRRPEITTVLNGASKVAQIDDIHAGLSQPPLADSKQKKIEAILGKS